MNDKNEMQKYNHINFITKKGRRALVKCPECYKENYAINVLSGVCTWCGFDINEKVKDLNDTRRS